MIVKTKEFKTELEYVKRFTDKKSTIPVLQNALITVAGNKLSLTGTNLDLAGMTSIDGDDEAPAESWATSAPVDILLKYLKVVDDAEVRVSVDITKSKPIKVKKTKIIDGLAVDFEVEEAPHDLHKLIIRHGDNSEATFDGIAASVFPEIPVPDKIYGELRGLKEAYKRTEFSISKEESRFTLSGAKLVMGVEGAPSALIAADGHRLSYLPIDVTALRPCQTIISKDALYEAQRMNGDSCLFGMGEKHQIFVGHRRSIVARILEGNFPDYERVLPNECWRSISMDVEPLLRTVKRVAVCADERSHCLQFYVQGQGMVIEAKQCSQSAKGILPIEWPDQAEWKAGLNANYVAEFLSQVEGTVSFNVPENGQDGIVHQAMEFVTPAGWRYVVMPMRI